MRMRKRHNLGPRMDKCRDILIEEPETVKGRWKEIADKQKVYLEIGCGKGKFTSETAAIENKSLFVAIEKVPDAMIIAMERIKEKDIDNTRFISGDASDLKAFFNDGEVDRIYINFCDPWPKSRDAKLRLTAPSFLRMYSDILSAAGEIHFKTDNTPLFDWSIEQLKKENWSVREITHNLHENGPVGIMTDYEAKFYSQGMKINRLVAVKGENTLGTSAGVLPRLRNASLIDAIGYSESAAAAENDGDRT